MARDYRFSDRLDYIMGIMAFAGVGIALALPFLLIVSSIFLHIPFLETIVLVCQVGGCIITGVALSYFICRKEM